MNSAHYYYYFFKKKTVEIIENTENEQKCRVPVFRNDLLP